MALTVYFQCWPLVTKLGIVRLKLIEVDRWASYIPITAKRVFAEPDISMRGLGDKSVWAYICSELVSVRVSGEITHVANVGVTSNVTVLNYTFEQWASIVTRVCQQTSVHDSQNVIRIAVPSAKYRFCEGWGKTLDRYRRYLTTKNRTFAGVHLAFCKWSSSFASHHSA